MIEPVDNPAGSMNPSHTMSVRPLICRVAELRRNSAGLDFGRWALSQATLRIVPHLAGKSKTATSVILVVMSIVTGCTSPAQGSVSEAERLADALMDYRLADGSVVVQKQGAPHFRVRVIPYFSNLAALAWTETAMVTTDTVKRKRYLDAAQGCLDWYARNQNPDGTIYDFVGKPDHIIPTGTYDSTDSYPATYAMLLWRYHQATSDTAYLREKTPSLAKAYDAMFLTMDAEGLTYAKPGYYYRFLMDNCEVAVGLAAFSRLFEATAQAEKAAHARAALEKLKSNLGRFYSTSARDFGYALNPYGEIKGDLGRFYPDALANLFVLAFLAPAAEESRELLTRLTAKFYREDADAEFIQWWAWAAMATGYEMLRQQAVARMKSHAAMPDAHSYFIGMTAATLSTGIDSISYPEARRSWNELTHATPQHAVVPSSPTLANTSCSLYLTDRNSTTSIVGSGWRANELSFPAAIRYQIPGTGGYLLGSLVFNPSLNLEQHERITVEYSVPSDEVQLRIAVVESDGDWWNAPVGITRSAKNTATFLLNDLTPSAWGKSGDGKATFRETRGIRLQLDNKSGKMIQGELTLHKISLTPKSAPTTDAPK